MVNMYASAQFSATLKPWPRSRQPNREQCKDPLTSATWLRRFDGQWTGGRRLQIHRLHLRSDSHLTGRFSTSGLICNATNTAKNKVPFSRDELTESQLKQWEEACSFLEGLSFNTEEADKMLGKAFGWVESSYWSERTVQTVPELEIVSSKVDFVKSLGFSDVELALVLKKFPELLGCRETLMKHNLGILDKEWGISGPTLKGLIKRNPHILGYSVDCKETMESS